MARLRLNFSSHTTGAPCLSCGVWPNIYCGSIVSYTEEILSKNPKSQDAYVALIDVMCRHHFAKPSQSSDEFWRRVFSLSPAERDFFLARDFFNFFHIDGQMSLYDQTA